jgi:hypothetical protein
MKKIILSILLSCLLQQGFSQLNVGAGANWITTANPSVVLQDINLVSNGLISGGLGSFRFVGVQNATISGGAAPSLNILEIAKTNGAMVSLNRSIKVSGSINFVSGRLDMNGRNIFLASTALINNETELNRITGTNGGYVQIIQNLSSPSMLNPGNLGAFITSTANLGSVTIRRYHAAESGASLAGSINRYYSITPTNNSNLNATLRLKYFDAELNGQNENNLVLYQSTNSGVAWNNLSRTGNSTSSNYVEKTAVTSLALQTLAPGNTNAGAIAARGANAGNLEMSDAASGVKIAVGPNPNNGNCWFVVSGIEKETTAALFTMDGKLLKQFSVFNRQQEKINSLGTGIYLLKVQGLQAVKIIVQ